MQKIVSGVLNLSPGKLDLVDLKEQLKHLTPYDISHLNEVDDSDSFVRGFNVVLDGVASYEKVGDFYQIEYDLEAVKSVQEASFHHMKEIVNAMTLEEFNDVSEIVKVRDMFINPVGPFVVDRRGELMCLRDFYREMILLGEYKHLVRQGFTFTAQVQNLDEFYV